MIKQEQTVTQTYQKADVTEALIDLILKGKKLYLADYLNSFGVRIHKIYYEDSLFYTLFIWSGGHTIYEDNHEADGREIGGRSALALLNKHWNDRLAMDKWDIWHAKESAELSL